MLGVTAWQRSSKEGFDSINHYYYYFSFPAHQQQSLPCNRERVLAGYFYAQLVRMAPKRSALSHLCFAIAKLRLNCDGLGQRLIIINHGRN